MLSAPSWVHEAIARLVTDASKVYALALGVSILVGGQERMAAPVYAVLVNWAPWWFWGSTLTAVSLLTLVPALGVRVIGFWSTAIWFWVWWAALTVNIGWDTNDPGMPKPGLTGLPTYAYLMVIFTGLAVASFMDWREKGNRHVPKSR